MRGRLIPLPHRRYIVLLEALLLVQEERFLWVGSK